MNQLKILKNNNIDFSSERLSNNKILLKIGEVKKRNVILLTSEDSAFTLKRELFNYLNGSLYLYSFWFINLTSGKMYYLEFKDKKNWLATSFSRTTKNEIYFGKEVLNNKKTVEEIINIFKSYK